MEHSPPSDLVDLTPRRMTHRSQYDFLKLKISEKYYLNLEPLDYKKCTVPVYIEKCTSLNRFVF